MEKRRGLKEEGSFNLERIQGGATVLRITSKSKYGPLKTCCADSQTAKKSSWFSRGIGALITRAMSYFPVVEF